MNTAADSRPPAYTPATWMLPSGGATSSTPPKARESSTGSGSRALIDCSLVGATAGNGVINWIVQ